MEDLGLVWVEVEVVEINDKIVKVCIIKGDEVNICSLWFCMELVIVYLSGLFWVLLLV